MALKELLLDLEQAVRLQTYAILVLLATALFMSAAAFGLYLKLDAWQFATKVMAGG